jgi:esterase/lipase
MKIVASTTADFIDKLYEYGLLKSYLDVNIVGYSLGGHTAGKLEEF